MISTTQFYLLTTISKSVQSGLIYLKMLLAYNKYSEKNRSISACLLVKRRGRYFALTFGLGGRFLIRENVLEEKFGLYATLNSSKEDSFRSIDKQSLDAIGSQSRTQLSSPVAPRAPETGSGLAFCPF